MATADLGWCLARCRIGPDPLEAELYIHSPANEDDAETSISILTLEAIVALRDLLDVEIADAQQRSELLQEMPQRD